VPGDHTALLTDEYRYRILKLLETDPQASQRRIADELDISLGRVNYCLQALIQKGLVKAKNFRNSANRRAYLYHLTAKGLEAKARVTVRFLKAKMREYEALRKELEQLQRDATAAQLREGERSGRRSTS
jgi:EPS-associated MarR family transcriptional regulator